jgi:hypothetical protein
MSDTQGTLDLMEEAGVKVSREAFIDIAYLGTPPDPWTALDEGELPDELQDWSLFEERGVDLVYTGPALQSSTSSGTSGSSGSSSEDDA